MNIDVEKLSKFLKESVDWLIEEDMGCTTLELNDKLAVCVGWLSGFNRDEEVRDDIIQSKSEPDFAIVAGIKVYTSDDMRTDFEFINSPFYKDGEVIDTDVAIEPDEDYTKLAEYLLKEYNAMSNLEMTDEGEIIETKKEEESLKEDKSQDSVLKSPYKDLIAEYFDYSMEWEFLSIVANVLGRIDDYANDEDIYNSIDDELIYTYDQWQVLMFYCSSPAEADWDEAYTSFVDDIMNLAEKIAEQNKEEESEEEESEGEEDED